ncbi:MAG: DMT family transporter [Desulforhopalus sp.]
MKNLFFYIMTVLIWGSTWIGIKLQLGIVDPMVSVGYRFALAALLLLLWCRMRNLPMLFTRKDHLFIALQGTFLFCFNYLLFYLAELHLTSGLAAVIFSTILLMNMINGSIFLKTPLDIRVITGGILGLSGIVLVFLPELTSFSFSSDKVRGILLCVLATYLASVGNILSARNQKNHLPIIQTNGFGMAYGAVIMLVLAFFTGKTFQFVQTFEYLGSLIYLSIFGTIIAFGCYLALIGNIGADRAAYATLLFPLVALAISTVWEGYQWTGSALFGVGLILCGNLLMIQRKRHQQSKDRSHYFFWPWSKKVRPLQSKPANPAI